MHSESLEIHSHYSIGFMCKTCGQTGRYNWQATDGETFTCSRCKTEHVIRLKIEVKTKHTRRRYLNATNND